MKTNRPIYFLLLMIFSLWAVISCKQNTDNQTNTDTITDSLSTEKTPKKTEKPKEEPVETLTTQSAIPFLYEYEKKNKERHVRIITEYGNIDIELFTETPYHRANFIFLAKQQYFDGSVFHRVVKNFVVQGGNSDSWNISKKRRKIGQYLLPPDTKKGFKHHRGIVSMPSSDVDNPYQFASPYEFFIVAQQPGAYHLDGNYTAFGRVTAGMDVVDKINEVAVDERHWPLKDVPIRVEILDN